MTERPKTRFVNRTGDVLHVSTPRGGRMALAPGQFVTDPYFRRFVKKTTERRAHGKFLTEEMPDGTPVGEPLPEPVAVVQAAPFSPSAPPAIAAPPPGGCENSCEGACQFPNESTPDGVADNAASINAEMDRQPPGTKPEPPAIPELPPPVVPQPASVPPAPPAPPSPFTPPAPPAPPAPPVVDPLDVKPRLTPPEIVKALGLTEQDVLDVQDDWLKVMLAGKETYVSRHDIEFKTQSLPSMKRHVKDKAPASA